MNRNAAHEILIRQALSMCENSRLTYARQRIADELGMTSTHEAWQVWQDEVREYFAVESDGIDARVGKDFYAITGAIWSAASYNARMRGRMNLSFPDQTLDSWFSFHFQ